MFNHQIKINLYTKASMLITLQGKFFFGETQRTLTGDWVVNIRDNKIFIENNVEVLIVDEEVVLYPLLNEECGFQIIDKQQRVNHSKKCKIYSGNLILNRDKDVVLVWNEVDIESVVTSILCHQFPECKQIEFLKVQSLILRSSILQHSRNNVLLPLNKKESHQVLRDSYSMNFINSFLDASQSNYISIYQGFPDRCNEIAHEAVADTMGKVLVYNDEVCYVPQTVCCGGITEGYVEKQKGTEEGFLKRTCDSEQYTDIDLSHTQNLEQWIYNPISCYCDSDNIDLINQLISKKMDQNLMLFRWNYVIKGVKVSSVLRNRMNVTIGKVKDIEIVERTVSGNAISIVVKGDNGNIDLKGDDLFKFTKGINLQSLKFLIESKKDINSGEINFTLNGSGTGFGLGLCQVGALLLAERGESMENILQHYFNGVYIEKQY